MYCHKIFSIKTLYVHKDLYNFQYFIEAGRAWVGSLGKKRKEKESKKKELRLKRVIIITGPVY